MVEIKGRAFLARSSRLIDGALLVGDRTAALLDADGETRLEFARSDLKFDLPLGSADRRATLPDGTLFETSDRVAVALVQDDDLGGALSNAETFGPRLAWVIVASVAGVFAIWKFALPALVWLAVALTPEALRDTIDATSLRFLDATLSEPTQLSAMRQSEVKDIFQSLTTLLPEEKNRDFSLHFRDMPGLGPNALALPGGAMVITDALVTDFTDNDVIAAVLGHELGHVVEDHGLTQLYRSLGIYVLVALIAGDTGPILEDILLEGGVIMSFSFSRAHETSADQFGLRLSDQAGYDPSALITFFETLPDADQSESGWGSTHPASGARIEAIEEFLRSN
ncbi:MAG: M48 family metallopeptidase [Silicimonas sp.]|nr:M48 family metallopeptidase [Silicimonas sp.]